jgi:hypothetical protein
MALVSFSQPAHGLLTENVRNFHYVIDAVSLPRIAAHLHPDAERIAIRITYVVEDFHVLRPGELRGADIRDDGGCGVGANEREGGEQNDGVS